MRYSLCRNILNLNNHVIRADGQLEIDMHHHNLIQKSENNTVLAIHLLLYGFIRNNHLAYQSTHSYVH